MNSLNVACEKFAIQVEAFTRVQDKLMATYIEGGLRDLENHANGRI